MRLKLFVTAVSALGCMGAAPAPKPAAPPAPPQPYLSAADIDTFQVLPPPPTAGTSRYEADRTVYLQTRKWEGTPRWELARADDSSINAIRGQSCAVGVELSAETAPQTFRLLLRVARDSSLVTNRAKDQAKRQRPYLIDEGNICVVKSDGLAKSWDYPSGHNTWGWSAGLVLAELAPDRATQIMSRARAFGESRLVCGVHNMSAVHMGWANASVLVAALHGNAEFRKDVEAARKELQALRRTGAKPDAARCAAEAEMVATPLY